VPETTHAARRERLLDLAHGVDAEAALVTRLVNVRYLTGFTGSNAALLVGDRGAVLCTDGRYLTQAQDEAPGLELLDERECPPALTVRAGQDGIRRLAFEAHDVSVETHAELRALDGAPELMPLGQAVETLRTVKDDGELALLREACAIGDRALGETLDRTAPGQTEREVARRLEACMVELGAEGVAFETIVATGPNSAIPHHSPTDREILRGDLLKIDFGARYGGYHADCTRTVVVGGAPADWQREIYDVVRRAQRAGRHALAVGADLRAVDAAARDVVVEAGYGDAFPHGLGHGVGLEIHEAPMLGVRATGRLAGRTPVTVEPGVYLPGRGGVRIEDTLVVGEGTPELLTTTSKDLLVL
jgi:Xaa-Pro aminopeptidase